MPTTSPTGAGFRPPGPLIPLVPRRRRLGRWALSLLLLVVVVATTAAAAAILAAGPSLLPLTGTGVASSPLGAAPPPLGTSGATSQASAAPGSTPTEAATASPAAQPPPEPAPKEPPPTSAPPEQLTGYVWPLRDARITSRFTARGFGGFVVIDGEEIHDGLDLATYCGNRVRAAHDGTVLYAGRRFDDHMGYLGSGSAVYQRLERQGRLNTLPIVVVIDDGNGYRSVYVHLSKASVEAGDEVRAGDVIGLEGATGFATGCHLHYTLIRMDGPWQVVVPELHPYGYPPFVRERIDPLRVLPRDHPDAPARLRNKFASPSPATPAPSASAGTSPDASVAPSPMPSAVPSAAPSIAPTP